MTAVPWPERAAFIASLTRLQRACSREIDRAQTGAASDAALLDACRAALAAWEGYAKRATADVRSARACQPPPVLAAPQRRTRRDDGPV